MLYVCNIEHYQMTNNKRDRFNAEDQAIANFCKVLSHPARIAILRILAEKKEIKTGNISDFLPISRPTVSRHLKELKEAEIIRGEIDGLQIHYCLNTEKITEIQRVIPSFLQSCISDFVCKC